MYAEPHQVKSLRKGSKLRIQGKVDRLIMLIKAPVFKNLQASLLHVLLVVLVRSLWRKSRNNKRGDRIGG